MNIILSNYFTAKRDPQRVNNYSKRDRKKGFNPVEKRWPKDSVGLVKPWIDTLSALGLSGTIFHDELSDSFTKALSSTYIEFVPYRHKTLWTVNEERFLCWYEYIELHPEFENILLTDLFDVTFNRDPFALLKSGYQLYVGDDRDKPIRENEYITKRMLLTYGQTYYDACRCLCAGAIMGSRSNVLKLLEAMLCDFEEKHPLVQDIDMGVFNKCAYDLFDSIMIGPPFTSRFKQFETDGAFAIRHK